MADDRTWRVKTSDGVEDLYVESDFEMINDGGTITFKSRVGGGIVIYPITGIVKFWETMSGSGPAPLAGVR
jgi:hypothetical protein